MGGGGGYTSAQVFDSKGNPKLMGDDITKQLVIAGGGGGGGAGTCPDNSYGIDLSSDLLRERLY
jgi:hypothetical protein